MCLEAEEETLLHVHSWQLIFRRCTSPSCCGRVIWWLEQTHACADPPKMRAHAHAYTYMWERLLSSKHKSVRNGFHLVWIEFHPFSQESLLAALNVTAGGVSLRCKVLHSPQHTHTHTGETKPSFSIHQHRQSLSFTLLHQHARCPFLSIALPLPALLPRSLPLALSQTATHSCGCNVTMQPVNIPRPARWSFPDCPVYANVPQRSSGHGGKAVDNRGAVR